MRFGGKQIAISAFVLISPLVIIGMPLSPLKTQTFATTTPASSSPCLGVRGMLSKVLVIVMENESEQEVIGSTNAPYQNRIARACGLATHYSALAHPSLPNYLAMTAGSTFGVTSDTDAIDLPIRGPSLFSQIDNARKHWVGYAESMPVPCDRVSSGEYAARHNPAVYYTSVRSTCLRVDSAMGSLINGPAVRAIASGKLPDFTWIAPNVCDDAHSCPESTGDAWLARFLPTVFAGPQYRMGKLAVFVTYDEGVGNDQLIPMIVAARAVQPGTKDAAKFTHYSLLATIEQLLGLGRLRQAVSATPLTRAFHL